MAPAKCPCCDGYGRRPRPSWEPGEGPVVCRACSGRGLVPALTATAPVVQHETVCRAPVVPFVRADHRIIGGATP
jgi:hypothetical protein